MKIIRRILALDLATKTGWAHSDGMSGVWDLSIRRDESAGMRLVRLSSKLDEMYDLGIDLLVYEAARHRGPGMQGALVVQSEIQGVLKHWCDTKPLSVQYRGYSSTEIKKHATGKGGASKEQMVAAAKKKWPDVEIVDHNQADAMWLLDLAMTEYLGT